MTGSPELSDLLAQESEALRCIACGYNLRELPQSSNCPECGLAIERSVGGDRLARADAAWLRHITRGQSFVAWGVATATLVVLALGGMMIVAFAALTPGPSWLLSSMIIALVIVIAVCPLVGLLLVLIGVLLLTRPDPRVTELPQEARSGVRLRLSLVLAIVFGVIRFTLPVATLPASAMIAVEVSGFCCGICVTVAIISLFRIQERLLLRIPHAALAKSIGASRAFFTWAIPLAMVLRLVVVAVGFWFSPALRLPSTPVSCITCVGMLLGLAILIRTLILAVHMFQARRAFRHCCNIASGFAESEMSLRSPSEVRKG